MEILKGKVQDPGFPDTEITYLKTDDGKTYFFIENGTLKNGNFIATPILKEGIGHAPYTSLGLLSPNGEVLIPFENKNIQVLSNDLLLVERNTPVTDSVKDALTKQSDPNASAELEANAKTIKDQINSVMGMNGSYVFDNQFSEAALYTTTGTNLANNYFSFIGSKEGAYYMSSNVVGSPISKYDPYAFAMNQEESEEAQQETPADVQNNEVPQENVETAQAETNSVPDINIPAVDNNTAPAVPEGTTAVDISNQTAQNVDTTPLNFDANLLNNQETAIPEVNPETPVTEPQAEEPAAVPGLDIPLFNQNIEETPNSSEEQQPTSEEQTPEVNLPSAENNQVEETAEQPAETVEENTSDIEETSTEKEEQPTEEVEDNNEGESSEIPTTDIFNKQETNSEDETSEQIENTEDTESEEKEVPEDNESEETEDSVEEETSTEEEEQSTEDEDEEEEDSSEEESSEIPTTDIFNEQETNSEDETSEEIENTEDSESEEKEEQPTEDEDEEEEDSGEEESTEDDTTGGTYKEEKEEDIEEQINNPVIANATSTIKKLLEENRKQRQLVDQQEGEIESLNSTNDILKEDNSSKTKEIISLRNNLGKYRKDNGELLRENNHLKSVVSRQDDLIEHLKSQNSMLKEQVAGITALGNIVAEANTVFNDGIEETSYEDNNLEYGYLDSDEDSYQYSKKSQ